jgi:hypothetical protein
MTRNTIPIPEQPTKVTASNPLPVTINKPDTVFGLLVEFIVDTTTSAALTDQTLVSATVPAGKKWFLLRAKSTCYVDAIWRVKAAGVTKGFGANGVTQRSDYYDFDPDRELAAGTLVEFIWQSASGTIAGQDLMVSLQCVEQDV